MALSLDHAYQAFETILLRLERSAGLPEDSDKLTANVERLERAVTSTDTWLEAVLKALLAS